MEVSASLLENGDSLLQAGQHAKHTAQPSDPQAPSTPSETGGDSSAESEDEQHQPGQQQQHTQQEQQQEHEEGSEEAQDMQGHAVKEVSLVCPQPEVEKLESTYASLVWASPRFAGEGPAELQIHRFEVDWAQVAEPGQPIQENDWRPLPSGDVDTPDVKVAGLRPGYTYAVRVRPVLDCDDIDQDSWEVHTLPSPPAVFTTLASVPSQAKPPLLVSKERKAIKVKWAYPEEPGGPDMCISYSLFVSPPPTDHFGEADPEGFVMVYSGEDQSFKLQKLVPGQRYTFWVLYWNQLGCSERGLPATYSTQATVPAQPTPPVPVKSTESSISFHWKAPPSNGSDITSYHLERDEGMGQGNFVLAYAGPLLCTQVKGLRSGTPYRFRLRATNGEGPSYWSECISASTAASLPSCPTTPVVTHVAKESATMTWGLPEYDGGAPVGFHEVQLQALSKAATDLMGPDWLQTFEGTTQGCTFMQLRPGCAYRARIRSANSSGWGPYCFPVEFATSPEVPDAPGPPAIQEGGATSLVVQWHPPLHNGGARITCYQLHMCPLPGVAYQPSLLVHTLTQQQLQRNTLAASASMAASMGLPPALQPLQVQAPQLAFSPPPPPPPRQPTRNSAPPHMGGPPMPQSHPMAHRAATHMAFHSAGPMQMPIPLMPPTIPPRVSSPISPVAPHVSAPLSPPFSPPVAPFYAGNGVLLPQPPLVAPPEVLAAHVEPTTYLVYAGEEPIAHVTGLQPGGAYQFRARAINSEGPGKWSEWSVLGTAAGPPPAPSPPLAASRPSSTALAIKWQAPASNCGSPITGYVVQVLVVGYVPSEGLEPRLVVRKPTSPNGLSVSQELRQRSRAASASPHPLSSADLGSRGGVSSVGGGQSSASVSAHSDETGVENGGDHTTPDMLVMGAGEDHLHGAAIAPQWTTVCKCSTPSTELRNLEPSTRYAIRVAAVNQVGQSGWSGESQLQTAPAAPSPPSGVQAEAMGPRSIGVAWLPCSLDNGAPVVAYAVDVLHLGVAGSATFARLANAAGAAGPWEHVATLGPADFKTMIVGSLPGRSYRVRVRAVNACGPSQPAYAPSIIATHAAPPGPPGKVVVLQRGAQHARFKWEPCHEENGAAVNQYCLEINGPVSNDFAPCGDMLGRAPSKTARSSHTGSMDESMDEIATAAALDNVEPSSSWRVAYIGGSTQARIPGLLPATHYWCRVHGCNRAGPGPCSQAEAFNTTLLPPGPPQGVEASLERAGGVADLISAAGQAPSAASLRQPDREVVTVRWEAPDANELEAQPVGYEVLATPGSGSPQSAGEVRCPAPKGALGCVLDRGLMAGIAYLVRVRAVGAGGSGHGPWSEACEVIAPGPPEPDSASTSELDAVASSSGNAPSADAKSSSKKRKGNNKQANAQGTSQALVPQPKGSSGGAAGKAAKSSPGAGPLVKPEPSLTTWRGIKLQGSRMWKRVKAFKWHIACLLLIAAATSAFQMFPIMELLARHKESVMLILLFLILFSLICLVAHIWVTWKQPPPSVKSKQKKT